MLLSHGMWFETDSLHYLTQRGTVPGHSQGLFRPWGGHWQTVPILLYRGLFDVFGLRTYLPYVMTALVIHLAICGVLWWLVVRCGAQRWVATAAVWVLLFFGAGAEAFFYDAPIPLTLALLLGLLAVAVLERGGYERRPLVIAAVLLLVAVMSSGMGLVGLVWVVVHGLQQGRVRGAVIAVSGGAVAFVIWFLAIGHSGGRIQLHGWDFAGIPTFAWQALTGAVGNATAIPETGGVLLLALLAVVLLVGSGPSPLRRLAIAGFAGAVGQVCLNALASLGLGTASDASVFSRYQYLVVVQLVPAFAFALQVLVVRLRAARLPVQPAVLLAATGVLVLGVTVNGIGLEQHQTEVHRPYGALFRAWVFGSVAATDAGERMLTVKSSNGLVTPLDFSLMTSPQIRASLPSHRATPTEQVQAESEFFVGVRNGAPYDLAGPTVASLLGFTETQLQGPGCFDYHATVGTPAVTVALDHGTELTVTSTTTQVTTTVVRNGVQATRDWTVASGTIHVATSVADGLLVVQFHAGGDYTICVGG